MNDLYEPYEGNLNQNIDPTEMEKLNQIFLELRKDPEFQAFLREELGLVKSTWYLFPGVDAFSLEDTMKLFWNFEAREQLGQESADISPFSNPRDILNSINYDLDDCKSYIFLGRKDGSHFKRALRVKEIVDAAVDISKKGGCRISSDNPFIPFGKKWTEAEYLSENLAPMRLELLDNHQQSIKENSKQINSHIERGIKLMESFDPSSYCIASQPDPRIVVDSNIKMIKKFNGTNSNHLKEIERLLVYNENKKIDPKGEGYFMPIQEGKELLKSVQKDILTLLEKTENFFESVEEWKTNLDGSNGPSDTDPSRTV